MPDLNRSLLSEGENADTLGGLTDVSLGTPAQFETLIYDGTVWTDGYAPVVSLAQNAESNTLTVGTVVYLFGGTGSHASVKRADNTSDTTSSKTVGMVAASIGASSTGPIITRGYVTGMDLSTGYAAGDVLWLGTNGQFTKTKTTAPNHLVYVGVVVRATNNGIIYVATQNGYELDELHNVSASSPASGDFLKYNGTVWVNSVINLGTDTDGNYMSNVTGGNLITITHTPSEGSNATIAVSNGTSGQAIIANATGIPTYVTLSGDATLSANGNIQISSNTIVNADVNSAAAIALSKLASGSSAQIVLANATGVPTYTTVSGDVTITNAGNVQIAANAISNADISTTAAIQLSKLATGSSAQIVLANATGVPTYTTVSGDVTISNTGVTALASNITISNNLIVSGNLTVNGTTTTVNTATLNIADNLITLNSDFTSGAPTENAGIEVLRGSSATVAIRWNETTDKWQFTTDGTNYTDFGAGGASVSDTPPSSPAAGQIWFESDTGSTFVYYDSHWIEIGASGMGAYVADTAPSNPIAGQIWFNSSNAGTYVYYDSHWIELGASAMAAIVGDAAPTSPVTGQVWYNSSDGGTYVYYDSAWVEIGSAPFNSFLGTINAKGDLLVGTADNAVSNLTVGTNGQYLAANSATTTGLEWKTVDALPSQTGNSGKYLTTNGTAASWATIVTDVMTDTKNAALIIMDIGV